MSTRSHIAFFDSVSQPVHAPEALIYRHWDGYPEGILPELVPILQWFDAKRGLSDIEYAAARTLQHLCLLNDGYNIARNAVHMKVLKDTTELDGKTYRELLARNEGVLSYGIAKNFHWDVEYVYCVYGKEKLLRAYAVNFEEKKATFNCIGEAVITKELDAETFAAECSKDAVRHKLLLEDVGNEDAFEWKITECVEETKSEFAIAVPSGVPYTRA